MMKDRASYCPSCGQESGEGTRFCSRCGAPLSVSHNQPADAERKSLLEQMEHVREVAALCTPHYEAYNKWQVAVENAATRVYENRSWKTIFYIGLPIAIILGLPMLAFAGSPGYIAAALPVFLMIGGWIVACRMVYSSTRKRNEHQKALDRQTTNNAQEQQRRIINCIDQIYEESGLSDFYPQEYLFENAVDRIISLIRTRRADTVKEGINLYEEEQHRIRMEQAQDQRLTSLYRAEELQRRAGDMAALAATMSALSLLRRR